MLKIIKSNITLKTNKNAFPYAFSSFLYEEPHFFLLCCFFKEYTAVGIFVLVSQISYKCIFNFIIGAFIARVEYDLIYALKTHLWQCQKSMEGQEICESAIGN